MELKDYQKKVLETLQRYLESCSDLKQKNEMAVQIDPEFAMDVPRRAWEKTVGRPYKSESNGLGENLPSFYLKVPTSGGKTFLACHAIDLVNRLYLKRRVGLVLWIVPTSQIYRQTLDHLRDREHPYRQVLDVSCGGRTMILEKGDRFTRLDTLENLIVMLLMLPSANRLNNEVLRVFKDSGGFEDMFPAEDDKARQESLLREFPNLDCFGEEGGLYGRIAKTSLGNSLRILRPTIIVDEGHKAYSANARSTITNFNPSILIELSATPPEGSNRLVDVSGQDLNREEMIKLDLHIINKASTDWERTLLAAVEKRNALEDLAKEYDAKTGRYIRPICLVQAERTGADQLGTTRFIHAEHVRDYLVRTCGVSNDEVAVKSSEKDDIEGINLLERDCPIRYIITKQALQEGWDCSFAYVLVVLTNPSSELGITQLVGRILRQPYAKKTKVKELDESYVFFFRRNAKQILENVKNGLESEGMGDLAGRVTLDEDNGESAPQIKEKTFRYREYLRQFEGKIYLPKFAIQEKGSWRELNYEMDILRRIDWKKISLDRLRDMVLTQAPLTEQELVIGLSDDKKELIRETGRSTKHGGFELSKAFLARQIVDIVPNPWTAFEIGAHLIGLLRQKHEEELIKSNFTRIIEDLREHLRGEVDRVSEQVFKKLVQEKTLAFFLISERISYQLPSHIEVRGNSKLLVRDDNTPIQRSLFEAVPEEEFVEEEKTIALYLDGQEKLLWWYRNLSRQDYYVQGWKRHRIYPDFLLGNVSKKKHNEFDKIFVVEAKGVHLKNEDTAYKQSVFEFCNALGKERPWAEIEQEFPDRKLEFQVVFENEWWQTLNKTLELGES